MNLFMASTAVFYLLQVGLILQSQPLFVTVGADYRGFWSAAQVANLYGYASVYDLDVLFQVQQSYFPWVLDPSPTPFFAAFIPLFQLFALLEPAPSFWTWTILNGIGQILYLDFFLRKTGFQKLPIRMLLTFMLSFSVFQNFFWGQVNVLLMICIGEFTRSWRDGAPLRGGLWLAGLLLKPQTLILVIPALLFNKNWKSIFGFACGSLLILVISLALGGVQGLLDMAALWANYLPGIATNAPENMMNWRMFGLHLSAHTSVAVGWSVAVAGMIVTTAAAASLWRRPMTTSSTRILLALLGTLAATGAVTWHSHVHLLMILIPVTACLYAENRMSLRMIELISFAPTATMFLIFLLGSLMGMGVLPVIKGFGGLLLGTSGLALNIYLVHWAIKTLRTMN